MPNTFLTRNSKALTWNDFDSDLWESAYEYLKSIASSLSKITIQAGDVIEVIYIEPRLLTEDMTTTEMEDIVKQIAEELYQKRSKDGFFLVPCYLTTDMGIRCIIAYDVLEFNEKPPK